MKRKIGKFSSKQALKICCLYVLSFSSCLLILKGDNKYRKEKIDEKSDIK